MKFLIDSCISKFAVDVLRGERHIVFWIPEEGKDPGDVAIMLKRYAQPQLDKLIANIS